MGSRSDRYIASLAALPLHALTYSTLSDQSDLPLNNAYTTDYDGTGVDVYILDTGLDTNHDEFKGRANVRTVYDAFASNKEHPATDNDRQGHGTHVAGTIGGKTLGIAKGASLLSVRILNDDGQGTVSDIVSALEFIVHHRKPGVPTVMSMSLGGPCQPSDCTQDALVQAVQAMAKAGLIVSVAAGNSACNACSGSPNAAPDAITTGATTKDDEIAYFSNFGQCVDVFAPGHEILSACANVMCEDEHQFLELSGTSMACPHVTGVIAQLLQRFPLARTQDIIRYLTCDAAKNRISLDSRDTLSRNLLLQAPKLSTEYGDEYCGVTSNNCPQDCNRQGICMPLHPQVGKPVSDEGAGSTNPTPMMCQCDYGWYGTSCGLSLDPLCPEHGSHNVKIYLYDASGEGWSFATYSISDLSSGAIVGGAMDSMCYGSEAHHSYCLPDGCYKFEVSKGQFPGENEWKMCGITGGTPFSGEFCIRSGHCLFQCTDGNFVDITMEDSLGQGWNGAYYEIYTPDGRLKYGGGLLTGSAGVHTLCLPTGCSYVMMESTSSASTNGDMKYDICGRRGTAKTVTEVCIQEDGSCLTPSALNNFDCPVEDTSTVMYLFDRGGDGWGGASYSIQSDTKSIDIGGTLKIGFSASQPICLPDGCYDFSVLPGSHDPEIFWNLCGHRGVAPFESQLCVEKNFNFCYGLSGCPALKSYLHHSDAQYYFVYHPIENGGYELDSAGDLHGVHELCGLSQTGGCHRLAVGSGKRFLSDEDKHFKLCDITGSVPATGDVCLVHNTDGGFSCAPNMKSVICHSNEMPQLFAMADEAGDGWGAYFFQIKDSKGKQMYKETLSKGSFGTLEMCFKTGCYDLSFGSSSHKGYGDDISEILWVFCGVIAPAVDTIQFCVTDTGCEFQMPDDDAANYYYYAGDGDGDGDGAADDDTDDIADDDFPADFKETNRPTAFPTVRVIGIPTVSQRPTIEPSAAPSSPHAPSPTAPLSVAPTRKPSLPPQSRPPSQSPTHPFGILAVKMNITLQHMFSLGENVLWSYDYTFVSDGAGKILESETSDLVLHDMSARIVALRPYFDTEQDGSSRKLLAESMKKNVVESVRNFRKLFESRVRKNQGLSLGQNAAASDGRLNSENTVRSALALDAFITIEVILKVSNSDRKAEKTAWELKEVVDSAILLANVDGNFQRKLLRSFADHNVKNSDVLKGFRLVGVGIDSKTIPRFDITQYNEKPVGLVFDDDDLFDDTYGSGTTDSGNVDTAAIAVRTNVVLGFVTAIITATIVLAGAMVCIYRESGNRMKFALDSLILRGSPEKRRGIVKRAMHKKIKRDTKEIRIDSAESVTVVLNPVYNAEEQL